MPENKPGWIDKQRVRIDYKEVINKLKSTLTSQYIAMDAYDSSIYMVIIDQCEKALERQKSEKPIIQADDVAFRFDMEA